MKTDSIYLQNVRDSKAYLADLVVEEDEGFTFDRPEISQMSPTAGWIFISIVLVAMAYLLIRKFLFVEHDDKIKPAEHSMGGDTIFGHDWDNEITQQLAGGDYSGVAVLLYLRHLDTMHRRKIIQFHVSKTPGMFSRELAGYCESLGANHADSDLPAINRRLTAGYLRVRYGHHVLSYVDIDAADLAMYHKKKPES